MGKLIHAVKSRHPIGIANVINKECPTIVMAFKKLVLQEMDTCVAKLCVLEKKKREFLSSKQSKIICWIKRI